MLPQKHRLRHASDFKQIRQLGEGKRHPLIILLFKASTQPDSRFAFVASKRVGNAVVRNRAKRLIRESVHTLLEQIQPGWDCVFIARARINNSKFSEVETAVNQLLMRAELLTQGGDI